MPLWESNREPLVFVMAALIEWSVDVGASRWFLRVNSASEPALALYDGLGFSRHHDYVYRAPADAGSATPAAPSA